MGTVKIGTCGYGFYNPPGDWKEEYKNKLQAFSDDFKLVELNKTFYKLPMVKTVKRWRKEVKENFEFTLKAWQAITHPTKSPTWKNKDKLTKDQKKHFGYFKPNDDVFDAWEEIKKRADGLKAKVVVFQSPNSFSFTNEHEKNIRMFFDEIDRNGLNLAWEPRGDWNDHPKDLKKFCNDYDIIHVVDIMRRNPVSDHSVCYIRLHGLNENEYNYDYEYSMEEIESLAEKLKDLSENYEDIYCMFNNYSMYENADQLRNIM